ncbi:hypothetical protein [Actinomadura rubrobrunea]|uniref:hypothetical protein n=1 Tax=Actinomadura rubrobrunea TaxID=115335 RepID=UPI001D03A5D5|nr:hypothetical protein [Actinomadura rubrobrunea]
MKITRVTALVVGIAALAAASVITGVGYLVLADRTHLRYDSQAALRRALPGNAAAELRARGIALNGALRCRDIPGWSERRLRVSCHGVTADRKPVQVIGTGDHATRQHYFTILVDGRPLLQNSTCLGDDCRRATGR